MRWERKIGIWRSPVPLPEDYIEFWKQISGEGSYGPEFEVEIENLSVVCGC